MPDIEYINYYYSVDRLRIQAWEHEILSARLYCDKIRKAKCDRLASRNGLAEIPGTFCDIGSGLTPIGVLGMEIADQPPTQSC